MSKVAISYARFSSAPQAQGASLSRQVERAREYADANGLVLDPTLCFEDLGVSAWDQSNIEKGALGYFLAAVRQGRVPQGATLIVESFDRLSRATPLAAFQVFSTIIMSGLNLAILTSPPQVFSRGSVTESPFQLLVAITEMQRAHSESEHKSRRVSDAWARRRAAGAESRSGLSAVPPSWIAKRVEGGVCRYELIPDRVGIVKQMVKWALSGIGNHTIVANLNRSGVPPWVRSLAELDKKNKKRVERGQPAKQPAWEPAYVQKVLTSPALFGAVCVKSDEPGERVRLVDGAYPAVMSKDEFVYLQAKRSEKAKRKASTRKGKTVSNLFGGRVFCGYCRSAMVVGGYTDKKTGLARRHYACHGARTGKTECRMHGWPVAELEDSVLFWLTQLNFNAVLETHGASLADDERMQLPAKPHCDEDGKRVDAQSELKAQRPVVRRVQGPLQQMR